MSNVSFIAGQYEVQIGVMDDNGYVIGQLATPNAPVNGSIYSAYRVTHAVEITNVSPTRELATDRGGQRIRGQKDLGLSDLGTFTMTFSDLDAVFEAIITGGSVNTTTLGGVTQSGPNFSQSLLPRLCILAVAGASSRDDSDYDATRFLNVFFPSVQIAPIGHQASQNGGVDPNARQYTITPSFATKQINGQTWNDAAPNGLGMTYANEEAMIHYWDSAYKYGITTFIGDAAETDFELGYRPSSSVVSITPPADRNIITVNGVRTLPTSVNTTTGVVVMSAAPAAAAKVVALYPTTFVAI